MKKQDLKMTKEAHGQDKHCGVCHNGKKAFARPPKPMRQMP